MSAAMNEYSVPADFTIEEDENCTDILFGLAERTPASTVFRREEGGEWLPVRADDAVKQITAIAKGLIASGVAPGDRDAVAGSHTGGDQALGDGRDLLDLSLIHI